MHNKDKKNEFCASNATEKVIKENRALKRIFFFQKKANIEK